ncbi:MAG: DsbA family protein [Gaiellaceae bacterium]
MTRLPQSRHRFTAVLAASALIAAILISASQISARSAKQGATATTLTRSPSASTGNSFAAGIAQHGAALGSPSAPLTLVEYADLQCPYCGRWARETLPILVDRYVRGRKLRIVFNGMAFVGPDSDKALRTVVAAGRHDHLWEVVHGLYENQGAENSGWVTDELVRKIVSGVRGLDGRKLLDERWNNAVAPEILRASNAARAVGVNSTPSFQLGPTGGSLELIQLSSLGPEGIVPAIEKALAAR